MRELRVGVFGGSFSGGVPTIKLAKGKQITLSNQANGARYVIQLVKLTNATPPVAAPVTTPTSTTPTATTTTP